MKKKSAFTTLAKAVFGEEDDGGPAGGYTLFFSAIQGPNSVVLESFRKWECRDAEVSKFEYQGSVEKLIEWITQLDTFNAEQALSYISRISEMKAKNEERYQQVFVLSHKDLPELKVGSKA